MLLGSFLERPNRFVARVRLEDSSEHAVHVASSGRMAALLTPGARVAVQLNDAGKPGRVTAGLLTMVEHNGFWVSVDTAMPGKLLRAAFAKRTLAPFAGYAEAKPEVRYGESRIDFRLDGPEMPTCWVEVKSVTEVLPDPDGTPVARFPDAPTDRGARHLRELAHAVSDGYRAAVCFIIQRGDAQAFGPYDAIDPAFGETLRAVRQAGVEVYAWKTQVSPDEIRLSDAVPLRF